MAPKTGRLVYPLYLDVPMVVSFVAALEGGVATTGRVTTTSVSGDSVEGGGHAGFGLPAISSLLRLDLAGELKGRHEHQSHQQEEVERQHTAASLFNLLRWKLDDELGLVVHAKAAKDLDGLTPGSLVELEGMVSGDSALQIVEALAELASSLTDIAKVSAAARLMDMLLDIGLLGARQDADANGNALLDALGAPQLPASNIADQGTAHARPMTKDRREPNPGQKASRPSAPELANQISALLVKLRDDLRSAPVRDVVLTIPGDGDGGLRAVVTLSRRFLSEDGLGFMADSQVTVLGKVTRVLRSSDQEIGLLRRSLLRYMSPDATGRAYVALKQRQFLNLELPELVVRGPGLQILPLAIFT